MSHPEKPSTRILWIALAAVPLLVWIGQIVAAPQMEHYFVTRSRPFHAFVCAGEIAAHGGDPYRVEPLLDCEHQTSVPAAVAEPPGVVEPAPLPGYALAFFSLFSGLPYATAELTWSAILLASLVIATWALARMTAIPWYAIAATLLPNAGATSFSQAELPPLCIAAISLSALLLASNRVAAAAVAVSVAMLEPHIGLAAALALFVFAPKSRRTLLICGALYALVSFAFLGAGGNVEYFRDALPAQARAEVLASDQYSLTWLLHALGLSSDASLLAGSASYPVMLCVGLYAAKRWAAELRSPELLVLVPTAAVLIGGAFIHDIQLAAALPAALVIADRIAERRTLAFAGVALLAIPWGQLFPLAAILAALAVLSLAFAGLRGVSLGGRTAFAAAGILAVALVSLQRSAPATEAFTPAPIVPAAGAATNWQRHVEASGGPVTFVDFERRLLVWGGFAAVAFAAARSRSTLARRSLRPAPRLG
jgi:hypothetical protein